MDATNTVQYRKAKTWQLYLSSIHDLLLICFLFAMNFITCLGAGYYGLLATTVAMIATASRIFDAITDPIIAFIVERTDGKFGRYRPTMILGWIISASSILGMYFFCVGASPIVFILIYAVYVIGYSFMMTSQGGARVAFTNESVQRNRLGLFMGILTSFFGMAFTFYNTNYLVPKHGGVIDLGTMQELCLTMLVVSFIILVLTVISVVIFAGTKKAGRHTAAACLPGSIWLGAVWKIGEVGREKSRRLGMLTIFKRAPKELAHENCQTAPRR